MDRAHPSPADGDEASGPSTARWLCGEKWLHAACDEFWVDGRPLALFNSISAPPAGAQSRWLAERHAPPTATGAIVRTAGWPFRCTVSGRTLNDDESFRDWGMIRFGGPRTVALAFESSLPMRPIPLGLAANIVVHGAAWWCLLGGPITLARTIRARRRRRLTLCPRCGYDFVGLRDPGCPECGSGRTGA